ncbi:MAG: hypothetical protein AB7O21_01895 [Gammaproteobacteria bacterium]
MNHPLVLISGFCLTALLGFFAHTAWWIVTPLFALAYVVGVARWVFT